MHSARQEFSINRPTRPQHIWGYFQCHVAWPPDPLWPLPSPQKYLSRDELHRKHHHHPTRNFLSNSSRAEVSEIQISIEPLSTMVVCPPAIQMCPTVHPLMHSPQHMIAAPPTMRPPDPSECYYPNPMDQLQRAFVNLEVVEQCQVPQFQQAPTMTIPTIKTVNYISATPSPPSTGTWTWPTTSTPSPPATGYFVNQVVSSPPAYGAPFTFPPNWGQS